MPPRRFSEGGETVRTVVKVGTHAIAAKSGRPDYAALKRLVGQICALRRDGHEVVFVSSGAVAAGVEALGLSSRPASVHDVQMCAAVGQARFIYAYEQLFAEHGVKIGQLLLPPRFSFCNWILFE